MTDVNEAFHQTRLTQIADGQAAAERAATRLAERAASFSEREAAGKLRNLGNGRFQVTDPGSWDNGEILRLTNTMVDGQMVQEILPEHGIDMTTGRAAVYSRAPMWHELATPIPEGVVDIDKVMDIASLNYEVEKRVSEYRNPVTGLWEVKEGEFRTHRMDTGKALGTVGNVYELLQNRQSFEFLENLVGKRGLVWESAGALRDGARTFVSLRLPEDIIIDPEGVGDRIVPFITALNSHSGATKFEVIATPWRIICGNTERFALRDALVKWGTRHTTNAADQFTDAQTTFARTMKYFEQFVKDETLLAQTPFTDAELEQLIDEVFGELDEDPSKKAVTNRKNLTEKLEVIHASNVQALGKTAYAAERTLTQYADWVKPYRSQNPSLKGKDALLRATAVLEDTSADLKNKTHRALLLRTNR